jgi:Gly-Xaa carboxypeptidase
MRPETETGTLGGQSLSRCPAQNKVSPVARPDITEKNVNQLFKSDSFRDLSVQRLSGAIQVPTETFENLGRLGEDKRWDVFYNFEKYLKKTFPLL